jgi:hypothetical protein
LRLFEEVDPSFRRFGSAANNKTRRDDDRSFGTCETVEVPGNGIGIMYKWLFLDLWRTRRPRLAASDPNAQATRLQRDAYSRCRKMLDLSRMHDDRLGCGQGGFRSDWYRYRFRKSRLMIVCLVRRTWSIYLPMFWFLPALHRPRENAICLPFGKHSELPSNCTR